MNVDQLKTWVKYQARIASSQWATILAVQCSISDRRQSAACFEGACHILMITSRKATSSRTFSLLLVDTSCKLTLWWFPFLSETSDFINLNWFKVNMHWLRYQALKDGLFLLHWNQGCGAGIQISGFGSRYRVARWPVFHRPGRYFTASLVEVGKRPVFWKSVPEADFENK